VVFRGCPSSFRSLLFFYCCAGLHNFGAKKHVHRGTENRKLGDGEDHSLPRVWSHAFPVPFKIRKQLVTYRKPYTDRAQHGASHHSPTQRLIVVVNGRHPHFRTHILNAHRSSRKPVLKGQRLRKRCSKEVNGDGAVLTRSNVQ
jgi:hypothetical protein